MVLRIFKVVAAVAVALVVVALLGASWLFYRAMPAYSGTARIAGLSAETRVWRDDYGIPHVFARSADDAARALGYLHASERLYQMEFQRRIGQGRISEVVGADLVSTDRYMRTLGFYRIAQASFASMSAPAQARMKAYAEGVNAWLESHAPPPELLLLGDRPEPWTPADSLVVGKLLALQLAHNYELEALRARLARKLAPEQARWIFPDLPDDAPVTTEPKLGADHAELSPTRAAEAWLPLRHGASNEWVVAGARTVTGKPILANDPHLGLGAPILWYLARLQTPEGAVVGATLPGLPAVILGHNDHIAWGVTNADTDVQDLFVETVDPADPQQYLTPEGPKPFETRDETIHVKGGADVPVHIRGTRHGPVLSDGSKAVAGITPEGKAIAIAWPALLDHDTTVEAFLTLNRAENWNDFLGAMRLWQAPVQNLVYADTTGDIGFFSPGLIPVRKSGDGLAPTDGASGATDWTGWLPFEQHAQSHNPPAGFLFNANNPNVPKAKFSTFGQDYEETFRARRIRQFMDTIDKHSLDTSARMQADIVSLAAMDMKPILATIAPSDDRARQALAMLAGWNGEASRERPEPLIFNAFLKALNARLLGRLNVDMDDLGPYDATTLMSLVTQHPQYCDQPDKPDPQCKATLSGALDDALALLVQRDGSDMSQWRWGHEHVAALTHRVFSHIPLLDRLSDLSVPSDGDFYTLNRGGGFEEPEGKPFARTHGAGFRGLYDLSDLAKSRFMITTGESGHIFSSHYGDLVGLWNAVKSIPITGAEADLESRGARKLTLIP